MSEHSLDDGALNWLRELLCRQEEALSGQLSYPMTFAGVERLKTVRVAVNAHDEMVEALRAALPIIGRYEAEQESNEALTVHVMIETALAKAVPTQEGER